MANDSIQDFLRTMTNAELTALHVQLKADLQANRLMTSISINGRSHTEQREIPITMLMYDLPKVMAERGLLTEEPKARATLARFQ